jgi:hypothetical protein
MRLAGIASLEAAKPFLETRFLPEWEERFTVQPRIPGNAHRRLGREYRLEEILSVRVVRKVSDDHTVSWEGNRWGVARAEVCAGLRGAQVEIERRLDGSHWLRFRKRYLRLRHCPEPARTEYLTPKEGSSKSPMANISIWQKPGHFYFALTNVSRAAGGPAHLGKSQKRAVAKRAGKLTESRSWTHV